MHLLCYGSHGRPIYVSPEAAKAGTEAWLTANVSLTPVMVNDSDAYFFELEVVLPPSFTGNPTDGWTGTVADGYQPATLGLFRSETLTTWSAAGVGWDFSPGRETPETMANGWKKWFVRCVDVPVWWNSVMIDLTVDCDRYGKSLTGLSIYGSPVSLPHFPYAMPSQAATLQADLRAAGYTGAVVSNVSKSLTVGIKNHQPTGATKLDVTMSGTNVTAVKDAGVTISLPGYPYSMPSQRATLQTHLRSAGKSGAVVTLYADEWTIFLPNRLATGNSRDFFITFTPGDPYPVWDMFGNYQGENDASVAAGTSGNVRTPGGSALQEAMKAFARLGFINIPTPP